MFELRLAEASLELLRSVLGQPVRSLFSATLHAQVGEHISIMAHDFSFSLNKNRGFLTVRTGEWRDTPIFGINYFELRVEVQLQPYGFEQSFQPTQGWQPPYNRIALGHDLIPITRITVHEIEHESVDESTQEQVRFDHAICFERADGSQFCFIIADESIAGDLNLHWESAVITHILSESRIRHIIE